jgi:predicted ester cyclase
MKQFIDLAKAYLKAYADKDLQTIRPMLSESVELEDWNLSTKGKENFLNETRKNFEAATDIKINIRSLFQNENQVAAQLQIELDQGSTVFDVVDIITFADSGQILSVRAYKG